MIKPSKKLALAVEAVVDIAYHGPAEPVQSQDMGRRLTLPRRYLEQVMQQLVKAGILKGVRGPRGGYRLARERRRISVGDIVRVVRTMEAGDALNGDTAGSDLGHKVVRPLWLELHNELIERLDTVSIDDLCSRADQAGIESEGRLKLDYSI